MHTNANNERLGVLSSGSSTKPFPHDNSPPECWNNAHLPIELGPLDVIRSELRRRGLTDGGNRVQLLDRLQKYDKEVRKRNTCQRYWQSLQDKREHRSLLFPQFSEFPQEIQSAIWEFSLFPEFIKLQFITEDPVPHVSPWGNCKISREGGNPVALSVNRLSRHVALKRYHLVFGSKNFYANFQGPDADILLLDLGDIWKFSCLLRRFAKRNDKSTAAIPRQLAAEDFTRKVERIAFVANDSQGHNFILFWKKGLRECTNLREVLLIAGGTAPWGSGKRGTILLDDVTDLVRRQAAGEEVEWGGSKGKAEWVQAVVDRLTNDGLIDITSSTADVKVKAVIANRRLFEPWIEIDRRTGSLA